MIINTIPDRTAGSFYKCCTCGHVAGSGDGTGRSIPYHCSCDDRVWAYYSECPKCKHNKIPISHCSFCTNSGYGNGEYKYRNEYVSKYESIYESRGYISSFLRGMRLKGLLSEASLGKAFDMLFKD